MTPIIILIFYLWAINNIPFQLVLWVILPKVEQLGVTWGSFITELTKIWTQIDYFLSYSLVLNIIYNYIQLKFNLKIDLLKSK